MTYLQPLREATMREPSDSSPIAARAAMAPHFRESLGENLGENLSENVGLRGRRVFARHRLWRRAHWVPLERLHWFFIKPVLSVVLIAWYTARYAIGVRRRIGVPIRAQLAAQIRLGFGDWVNPRNYYFHEHYRSRRPVRSDAYVMRHEIKEGLLKALHKLRPKVHGRRVNLGHKMDFAETCLRYDLPTPPILAFARRGRISFTDRRGMAALDRDLFVKREHGRGAAGARGFFRVAPESFRDPAGNSRSLGDVLTGISRRSWPRPQIVQPMLRNHPEIADLAGVSLIAIRIFTCLDARDRPVVTHAMLRSLSKLEPSWPGGEEFAAAIHLGTGQLGPMCGDGNLSPEAWFDRHPFTGAQVSGRRIPQWPAILRLVTAAHRVFSDRMLLGWDVALTPGGPVLIEANSYPDTEFLQRVHRQPIGRSPLGPLLEHHLGVLEVRRGGFRSDFNA